MTNLTQFNRRIPSSLRDKIDALTDKLKADGACTQEQWLTAACTAFHRLPISKQKIAIAEVRREWAKLSAKTNNQ